MEYYDDETEEEIPDQEEIQTVVEEEEKAENEDPAVLKELVKLIHKAGGISNLEKQLQIHQNGSLAYKDPVTQEVSTTSSPISASLYDKILTRNQARKEYQPLFRSRNNVASSTENLVDETTVASSTASSSFRREYQPIRSRQNVVSSTENTVEESSTASQSLNTKTYQSIRSRQNFAPVTDNIAIASTAAPAESSSGVHYTGFSFNSRSGPQNQGLAQLDEFTGFVNDKPKYTVLSRTKAPSTESVEEVTEVDDLEVVPESTTAQKGIFQFQYVNLQRKPTADSLVEEKTDLPDLQTTLRPFTASSPRGFESR